MRLREVVSTERDGVGGGGNRSLKDGGWGVGGG